MSIYYEGVDDSITMDEVRLGWWRAWLRNPILCWRAYRWARSTR